MNSRRGYERGTQHAEGSGGGTEVLLRPIIRAEGFDFLSFGIAIIIIKEVAPCEQKHRPRVQPR